MRMSGDSNDRALVGQDVVVEVRVDGRLDARHARLHVGEEVQQPRGVEALGEALAVHELALLELGVGKQEAVGRDQVDARMIGPAREQRLEDARGGALADGDRAADADDERHLAVGAAEELRRHRMQLLRGGDVEVQEPRHRQVDLLDLLDRELLDETRELLELALLERHRRVGAQPRPLLAGEHAVGRELQVGGIGHRDEPRRDARAGIRSISACRGRPSP